MKIGHMLALLEKLRFDYETGFFHLKTTGRRAGAICKNGYVKLTFRVDGKREEITAHRLAWLMEYGSLPLGQIDHINQVKTDNRLSNLRDVSDAENKKNMPIHPRNKSGISGVSWRESRQRWIAIVTVNGKSNYLGSFVDKNMAADAVKKFRSINGFSDGHGGPRLELAKTWDKALIQMNCCRKAGSAQPIK